MPPGAVPGYAGGTKQRNSAKSMSTFAPAGSAPAGAGADRPGPYWNRAALAVAAELGSGPGGLSTEQADAIRERVGPNRVVASARLGALRLLARQFESPLVVILIFAALVSLALRQWVDASIILAIVFGSTLLGFFQEYRASNAVEQLKQRLALTCRVLRDGVERTMPMDQVVPGDVILLAAGNLVPADGLVLEAEDFLVTEASMTGKSFPVEKRPCIVPAEAPIGARANAVFLGASVRSGTAKIIAVETGPRTAYASIAARLKAREPETDFQRGVRRFGYLLVRVMVIIVLAVLTANLLLHRPVIESLLFAVALAVGLSPELLPAIISVTLSAGARAMSRRGVIVRRLQAIENLGSMDILCTDKTGTLTEGTIVLSEALDPAKIPSDEVRRLAFLNAALETGIDNPLDAAIVAAGESAGLTTDGFIKIDELPYDFLRRRLTIVVADEADASRHLLITKGAFANVLGTCAAIERNGSDVVLTPAIRTELDATFQAGGDAGFRVLALATRQSAPKAHYEREDERDMTFRGFLMLSDPPKPEAGQTIRDLGRLGIQIKVISGDNRYVTAHLAKAVGLNPESIITGGDLAKLKDEALWHLAPQTDLFVEIDPQQKERIVRAMQHAGHAVGYLGDGINDAPALHAADVGISVERRRRRRPRERRHHPAQARSRRAPNRRRGRPADFRQYAEIHLDHDQRQFRQHGQHGARHPAAAVPAPGRQTDPPQQLPLRHPLDRDLQRQCRSRACGRAAALGRRRNPALHDRIRPRQLGLRPDHFRLAPVGVPCRRGDLPDILVHDLRADRTHGRSRAANAWSRAAQPAWRAPPVEHRQRLPSRPSRSRISGRSSHVFGFVPLSPTEIAVIVAIVAGYILATEATKAWFYRGRRGRRPHDPEDRPAPRLRRSSSVGSPCRWPQTHRPPRPPRRFSDCRRRWSRPGGRRESSRACAGR